MERKSNENNNLRGGWLCTSLKGEVWLIDLGKGCGSEQSGLRPCVIVQNDIGNMYSPTTIVCPITSQTKGTLPTHVDVDTLLLPSTIICEQIRVVDKCRLKRMVAKVDMDKVDEALLVSLGLNKGVKENDIIFK